jgi:hypothetical protein
VARSYGGRGRSSSEALPKHTAWNAPCAAAAGAGPPGRMADARGRQGPSACRRRFGPGRRPADRAAPTMTSGEYRWSTPEKTVHDRCWDDRPWTHACAAAPAWLRPAAARWPSTGAAGSRRDPRLQACERSRRHTWPGRAGARRRGRLSRVCGVGCSLPAAPRRPRRWRRDRRASPRRASAKRTAAGRHSAMHIQRGPCRDPARSSIVLDMRGLPTCRGLSGAGSLPASWCQPNAGPYRQARARAASVIAMGAK